VKSSTFVFPLLACITLAGSGIDHKDRRARAAHVRTSARTTPQDGRRHRVGVYVYAPASSSFPFLPLLSITPPLPPLSLTSIPLAPPSTFHSGLSSLSSCSTSSLLSLPCRPLFPPVYPPDFPYPPRPSSLVMHAPLCDHFLSHSPPFDCLSTLHFLFGIFLIF
jgi:hypothetical protein